MSNGYSPVRLVFGSDTIQRKLMEINKDNANKNCKIVDHDIRVGYKEMFNNNTAYKYETFNKGPFEIIKCWNNETVTL